MRGAPRIGEAHLTDQSTNLDRHARSARSSRSRLPAPEGAKTSAMPADNRLRPNNCHRIENARQAIEHLEGRAL
jgi:hypothetical protein